MSKLKSALAVSILSLPFGTTADETKSFIEFGYTNIDAGTADGNGLNIKGGTGLHKNVDFVAAFYHASSSENINGVGYNADLFNYTGGIRLKTAFQVNEYLSVEPFLPLGMMYSTGDVLSNGYTQSANSVIPYYGLGTSVIVKDEVYFNLEFLRYDYEHGIHGNVVYADPTQVSLSFGFRF
ncbi:hypothetical protein B6A42_17120 [Vibrio coralliilyticus]|nr:hypothetical protein B6A42_17120 [Vibrio coralliilyticus]